MGIHGLLCALRIRFYLGDGKNRHVKVEERYSMYNKIVSFLLVIALLFVLSNCRREPVRGNNRNQPKTSILKKRNAKKKTRQVPIVEELKQSECSEIDKGELARVVRCYYNPGKSFSTKGKWIFASRRTRSDLTRNQFEKLISNKSCNYDKATVLGHKTKDGNVLARVSARMKCRLSNDETIIGIGIRIEKKRKSLGVIELVPNGPSEKAGLRVGDRIVSINGNPTAEISVNDAAKLLQGKRGTTVLLELRRSGNTDSLSVRVFRKEVTFAGESCFTTFTQTWLKEKGGWKISLLAKDHQLVNDKFKGGDYINAKKLAAELLRKDPFSVFAYSTLLFALDREQRDGIKLQKRRAGILRALLAINQKDSHVLSTVATYTNDKDTALVFLDRIHDKDCVKAAAVFNFAQNYRSPRKRLKFLNSRKVHSANILILRIVALSTLGRHGRVRGLLTKQAELAITDHLNRADAHYAAGYAVSISIASLKAEKKQSASKWANYAINRDPTNKRVHQLVRTLKKQRLFNR